MSPTRALAAVPRRSGWCAAQAAGSREANQLHTHISWALFFRRKKCAYPASGPAPSSEPSSAFLCLKYQNQIPERGEPAPETNPFQVPEDSMSFSASPAVKTRGRDDPKDQKDTFPTRGLEGRDITRGQYFQGAHKPPRYPYPITHSAARIAQPSPTSFSYTSPFAGAYACADLRHIKARWSLRLLGNAVHGKAEH